MIHNVKQRKIKMEKTGKLITRKQEKQKENKTSKLVTRKHKKTRKYKRKQDRNNY